MSDKLLGIETLAAQRTTFNSQTESTDDIVLIDEPMWESVLDTDEVDAVLPDAEAEIIVTRAFVEGSGTGELFFHAGDGEQIGDTITYTAGPGKSVPLDLHFGGGNPVMVDLTITSGAFRMYVEYVVRRKAFRKIAFEYIDADE